MTPQKFNFNNNAILAGILAIIFFCVISLFTLFLSNILFFSPVPALFLCLPFSIVLTIILYLLLNRWLPTRSYQASTAGPNVAANNLQGVVRGFKESRQIMPGLQINTKDSPDLLVWSFQLERHSEMEARLDPIPVEMRGKYFSGTINEGNIVALYEKSWRGGIIRTERVYNVSFKDEVVAHMETRGSIAMKIWAIFVVIIALIMCIGIISLVVYALYNSGQ